jgi:uncharacterized membrane protein YbhN (UPF0104 family)
MGRAVGIAARVGITLLGLAYVLRSVPLRELGQSFGDLAWPWVILSAALFIAGLVLRTLRWQVLLDGLGVRAPFRRLLELYFAGSFYNSFLPSGFGGDAVRMVELSADAPGAAAAGSVVVDRLSGLMALFAMALVGLPFRPAGFPPGLARLVAALCVFGLVASVALLDGRAIRFAGRWLPGRWSPSGDGPVGRFASAVSGCGRPAVLTALAISLLFNLLLVGWWYAAAQALGYDLSFTYTLLVVPILSVALLIPSVGGLGVREALSTILFSGAGLQPAEAVALSLLAYLIIVVASAVGVPAYLAGAVRRPARKGEEAAGRKEG